MARTWAQNFRLQMGAFVQCAEGVADQCPQRKLDRGQGGEGCCPEACIEGVKPYDVLESSASVESVFTAGGSLPPKGVPVSAKTVVVDVLEFLDRCVSIPDVHAPGG